MTRSDPGPETESEPGGEASAEQAQGSPLLAMLKWSALMLLGSLVIAAVSIPLLRLFGVEPGG